MSTNRDTLERLLRSGEIALERSPFLDQAPDPLPTTFSFDKIDGMMLGLAIGDALGITTESWLPSKRQAKYGEIRDYIPNKYVDEPIGFPSDDSQLAFWTLEQMLADGGFRPENVADCFCTRHIFGVGSAVREFLRNRKSGRPWQQCGAKSAGNGALMRIAPILIPHLEGPVAGTVGRRRLGGHDHPQRRRLDGRLRGLRGHALATARHGRGPADPYWWPRTYVSIASELEGDTKYRPRGGDYLEYEGPISAFVAQKLLVAMARMALGARPVQQLPLRGVPAGDGAVRVVHPDAARPRSRRSDHPCGQRHEGQRHHRRHRRGRRGRAAREEEAPQALDRQAVGADDRLR